MTFQIRNLSTLGYSQGFTLWHYRTTDALAEVLAPGHFDHAHDFFHLGDHMHISYGNRFRALALILCDKKGKF